MNIGYFSVLDSSKTDFINWNILDEQEIIQETKFIKHIRFANPLTVIMSGKKKTAAILFNT